MTEAYHHAGVRVLLGDARHELLSLPDASVQTCITSPPYWPQRDYFAAGQIGNEPTLDEYLDRLVGVFAEVKRVLRPDGTLWIVIGDGHAGAGYSNNANTGGATRAEGGKPRHTPVPPGLRVKDLLLLPFRLALRLQADGWTLRSQMTWLKPNPHPNGAADRPPCGHETVLLFARRTRYHYAPHPALGSVLTVPTEKAPDGHCATFPRELITPFVLAASRPGDTVMDPFAGSGTTLEVAKALGRSAIGIELQAAYLPLIEARLRQAPLPLRVPEESEQPALAGF